MLKFKEFISEIKKPTGGLKNACWKGYTAIGMKEKNGKKVPNCVKEDFIAESDEYTDRPGIEEKLGKGAMKSIMKHPFFQKHVIDMAKVEPKFRHTKMSDFHNRVDAISQPDRYVTFDMHGSGKSHRVGNAHLFKWDGKSRTSDGRKLWVHHSSHKEDKED